MRHHFGPQKTIAANALPLSDDAPPDVSEGAESAQLICKPRLIEPWRIFRIMAEFVDGFEILRKYGLAASFFGTARCQLDDAVYKDAQDLAEKLSRAGFTIITGGAAGVMEAANRGAHLAKGESVGLNIQLPHEQGNNIYLTDHEEFHHFFVRKVMLSFASEVYVFFPGGFGTLDEFFEIVTLVQTNKIKKVPVILMGKEYWEPLLGFIETTLYKRFNAINEKDMEIYHLADSVDEAYTLAITLARC